ncbi:MAG: winged helix-turn-helix domain-containing protein, partial [Gammaproteobacteria bacterium]
MGAPAQARRIRFGAFEADLRSGELHKHGIRIRLQNQPFQMLLMLLENPGELVTREELQKKLWPAHTFVDFENGLNTAVKWLRDALSDTADKPRFIETLPRRGYRFIGEIEVVSEVVSKDSDREREPSPELAATTQAPAQPQPGVAPLAVQPVRSSRRPWLLVTAVALTVLVAVTVFDAGGVRSRWFGAKVGAGISSIAVLPFRNTSGDPAQDYIADGLSDSVNALLSRIASLSVTSPRSTLRYAGTKDSPQKIARELGAQTLVDASVATAANRVQVRVWMVDGATGRTLWAESFDREQTNILALQNEMAREIVKEIGTKLTPEEHQHLSQVPSYNPRAYELYVRGRHFWHKGSTGNPEPYARSRELFEAAIDEDPNF